MTGSEAVRHKTLVDICLWFDDSGRGVRFSPSTPFIPSQLCQSTQRESNPHLRPGETVRCRYVIGAFVLAELSKSILNRTSRDGSSFAERS